MAAHRDDLKPEAAPRVAVCIPAYGRPAGLERLLASIAVLDYPRDRIQVVVAVDGPDTALQHAARAAGADDVVVLPENRGSYAARNAALDAIGDDVEAVLFTDTDAEVSRHWVDAHLKTLAADPRSGGAVHFGFSDPPRPAEVVDARRHLQQQRYVETLGYAATVNLAVRREVTDRLRFDATRRSGGDFEFGQRCTNAGLSIAYAADAIVHHAARSDARTLLRKVDRVARGARKLEATGQPMAATRADREPIEAVVRSAGLEPNRWWMARARAIDAACSLAYARRVPSVLLPALRRALRLSRGRPGGDES